MFPHPKPLFAVLLPSLITASILIPRAPPPNDPNLPALLLPAPTNDTLTLPNISPADDGWYPYYVSSLPTNLTTAPSSSSSSSSDTTPSNISSLTATAPKIVCNGARYGRNLRVASCFNAYDRMDDADVPKTYGQRDVDAPGHVPWDANLPLRILSSDAFCAIDISHSARATSDTITPSLLKAHALTLLTICVQGSPSIGGVSSGLGEGGNLALRVTPYRPKVHCFGPGTAPPWSTCREVVDSMSVSGRTLRFGPVEDVLAEVVVPWVRTTRERRCAITIDTISTPDVSDFYKLWAAANAVDTLCIIKGKAGMAVGNGLDGNLVVGLKDLRLEPGTLNASTGVLEELDVMS